MSKINPISVFAKDNQNRVIAFLFVIVMAGFGGVLAAFFSSLLFIIWLKMWFELTVLPFSAFFFVLTGSYFAYGWREIAAYFLSFLVLTIAFFSLGKSIHRETYEYTFAPLIAIFISVSLGVAVIAVFAKRSKLK